MLDLPSNSHGPQPTPQPEKKVEKVVEGAVIKRKKPLGRRIRETFVGGDMRSVGQFITFEVMLPALKDTIADVASQGIERMLFGEARSTSRRTGYRPGQQNQTGYINYGRISTANRRQPELPSRRLKAPHGLDEIILQTRREADEVIARLYDLINKYESASVADLYELVGIQGAYTDDKWGWTDLPEVGSLARRVTRGYLLDLPDPEPL